MPGEFAQQVTAMQTGPEAGSGAAAATPPTGTETQQGTPTPGAPAHTGQQPPADAGATAAAPAGTAPAATPPAEGAPPTGDDKRVTDAQRAMHQATTERVEALTALDAALRENAALKETLTQIDRAPDLAQVADPQGLPTEQQFENELRQAVKDYQTPREGEDDATALVQFETTKADIFQRRVDARQAHQRVKDTNTQRALAVTERVTTSITKFVADHARDVPIGLFWWHTRQAQAETPPALKGVDAYDWQVKRAIALARAEISPQVAGAARAATDAAHVTQQASVVMPAGGSPPTSPGPAQPEAPKTMVEQLREQQAKVLAPAAR